MIASYLVKDWSQTVMKDGVAVKGEPALVVVRGDEIFKVLDNAKLNNQKISIYKIGECVLDWS